MIKKINLYPELEALGEYCHVGEISLGDDSIILIQLDNANIGAVENWVNYSTDIRYGWDDDKPLYIMVDTSKCDFVISARTKHKLEELNKVKPHLEDHLAWIIPQSIMGTVIKTGLLIFNRTAKSSRAECFYNREDGYQWLQTLYEKKQHNSD